jgi:type IV pilus assembly protein PilM
MPYEELEDSIQLEAENYIPFDVEEVNLDFHILTKAEEGAESPEQMEVLLVAVKKEKVNECAGLISGLGLRPLVVDVDVFAIENAYEYNYGMEEGKIVALVDIGAGMTNINILEDGITTFTRDIPFGGNNYNQAIQNEHNLSFETAEKLKLGEEIEGISPQDIVPLLISTTEEFSEEIQKSFDFFRTTGDYEVDKIVLSGGCSRTQGIDRYLSESLGLTTETFNPFKNIVIDEKSFDPEYIQYIAPFAAVGVGLALRKLGDK